MSGSLATNSMTRRLSVGFGGLALAAGTKARRQKIPSQGEIRITNTSFHILPATTPQFSRELLRARSRSPGGWGPRSQKLAAKLQLCGRRREGPDCILPCCQLQSACGFGENL